MRKPQNPAHLLTIALGTCEVIGAGLGSGRWHLDLRRSPDAFAIRPRFPGQGPSSVILERRRLNSNSQHRAITTSATSAPAPRSRANVRTTEQSTYIASTSRAEHL